MSHDLLERSLEMLSFSRRTLLALLEDIPADRMCFPPVANGNHALWVLGHVTVTDDYVMHELGKQPRQLAEQWHRLFGPGSTPVADAGAYPGVEEVRAAAGRQREAFVRWMRSLPDEQLDSPVPEDWREFCSVYANLPAALAWHEGMHTGQVTVIRKALGMRPKFL